jgi:hypothetical protein
MFPHLVCCSSHQKIILLILGLAVIFSGSSILTGLNSTSNVIIHAPAPAFDYSQHLDDAGGNLHKFKTSAYVCPQQDEDTQLKDLLKSQSGEDKIMLQYFNGLCGGTYIEMGALDGIRYSNSYVFNKAFSWKGLMVELGPSNFKSLLKNRRNELALVNAGVCEKKRTLHYVERIAVGGIWEFAAPGFKKQWWPDIKDVNSTALTPIECSPLQDIIDEHIGKQVYFDFFSLDIEGAEVEAIHSIDFQRVGFGIILVESDKYDELKNMALRTFLESKGYLFLMDRNRSYWFVNKNFWSIYRGLTRHSKEA